MRAVSGGWGTIGILMGGYSSERDISLKSGQAITKALESAGCRVKPLDINVREHDQIASLLRDARIDVAFIALHGQLGEDGIIQTILEKEGIPYVGSGPEASRAALNKAVAYRLFEKAGIRVAGHRLLKQGSRPDWQKIVDELLFPLIVKPVGEGSSIGITRVNTLEELEAAASNAWRYGPEILVERYIQGRELTAGILAETPLPVIEIKPKNQFFDFSAKYQSGTTEYLIPAPLPQEVQNKIQNTALRAHQALGCRDLSRVDFMLDEQMNHYALEVNTIPGFTATSLLPKAAACAGIDFTQLCLRLVGLAYEKKN